MLFAELSVQKIFCEGEEANLECPPGLYIDIQLANYGRFTLSLCNPTHRTDLTTTCQNNRTLAIMKSELVSFDFIIPFQVFGFFFLNPFFYLSFFQLKFFSHFLLIIGFCFLFFFVFLFLQIITKIEGKIFSLIVIFSAF